MAEPKASSVAINMKDVQVISDRFCTRLTYNVEEYEDAGQKANYIVFDNCIGDKVVNVKTGADTYKIHDGCLRKISYHFAEMAKYTDDIVIESCFDPDIVNKTLTFVFKPTKINVKFLSSKEKYDMVVFASRYNLPPKHISKLIDSTIFADLVKYAWERPSVYLMVMLPKMRILDVNIAKDFAKVEDRVTYEFVSKYMEHELFLKKCRTYKIALLVAIPIMWLILFLLAYLFDGSWKVLLENNRRS
uniref:BTB domain-containing protein n=1 Tax=Panagrellus redivivus TaxID=6233 RepID=A0A7E4VTT5_PANRE